MNIEDLEKMIYAINEDSDAMDVSKCRSTVAGMVQRVRAVKNLFDEVFTEWLLVNDELVEGDNRYYLGNVTKIKCTDLSKTLEMLLEHTGGDFDRVVECLSSNAYKYGACRKVLHDSFKECFEESLEIDIKTTKPKKQIKQANSKYLKKGSNNGRTSKK